MTKHLILALILGGLFYGCSDSSSKDTVSVLDKTATAITSIGIPQTGQLISYANYDDGFYKSGIAWVNHLTKPSILGSRFTTGVDSSGSSCPEQQGVENDNLSGLMWVKNLNMVAINGSSAIKPATWQAALDSITAMNAAGYCGYHDWRLPNVNELVSLFNWGRLEAPAVLLNLLGFSNITANNYWSSTTAISIGTGYAWQVSMGNDGINPNAKNDSGFFWPVRGSTIKSPAPAKIPQTGQTTSYAIGDDGSLQVGTPGTDFGGRFVSGKGGESACITDSLTGLMWPKNAALFDAVGGGVQNWNTALLEVNAMNTTPKATGYNLCGYKDWRLPNVNELRSLINWGQVNMLTWLNSKGFTNLRSIDYWSSTSSGNYTGNAWYVNLSLGDVNTHDKFGRNYVWPVRGGH